MCHMDKQWDRVARAVVEARHRLVGSDGKPMTQPELATLAGISLGAVQMLEDETHTYRRWPAAASAVERVLWEPGSVKALLRGGEPTWKQTATPEPAVGNLDHLPLRVRGELTDGEVVDTDVIDLSAGGMKLVVVVTRDADAESADDDQMRRGLREWARIQRQLRSIGAGGDNAS